MRSRTPALLLALAAASWGVAAALSKVALEQLSPLDLFSVEVTVGLVPLVLVVVARGARPGDITPVLLALGLLEPGLSYALFDFGVSRTSAVHGALLLATETPLTVAFAVAFLHERAGSLTMAAVAAAIGGSVLVSADGAAHGGSAMGDLLVLASVVTAAGYAVLARRVAPGRDAVVITAVQMLGAAIVAVPAAAANIADGDSRLGTANPAHLATACLVGVLAGVLPFFLYNHAIGHMSASHAGLVLALVPVFGAFASVALLADMVSWRAAIGGLLAVAAAVTATRQHQAPEPAGTSP